MLTNPRRTGLKTEPTDRTRVTKDHEQKAEGSEREDKPRLRDRNRGDDQKKRAGKDEPTGGDSRSKAGGDER